MSTYTYDKGDISNIASKEKLEENIAKAIKSLENYPEEKFMETWVIKNQGVELMPAMPRIRVIRGFLMNHLITTEENQLPI